MLKLVTTRRPYPKEESVSEKVESIVNLIGNTPLLEIKKLTRKLSPKVRIFAKLEGFNPGGSVKDRAALKMLQEGINTGKLTKDKIILESSSGNTGIALAMIGRAFGFFVELVIPANVSKERKRIITAFGAKIILSDPMEGSDGAIHLLRKILRKNPDRYFSPDQYFNPMNSQAHYDGTGPEIYHQTQGAITHLVGGIGTGGTIMGAGCFLKENSRNVRVIAVEPDDSLHGLEGLKHMASSIVPGIFHENEVDEIFPIATEDAYSMVYRLSQEEGVLVGQSSGAAMYTALQIAKQTTSGTIVTIFPDFGGRYLTTNLWVDWRKNIKAEDLTFSI